ncbi:MAG: hypothetical protein DIJKHBIC_02083 [Thermoanaerobaculia bacterium]|nr:hypothetical protein [Thermoanaerobaculia bacterium]
MREPAQSRSHWGLEFPANAAKVTGWVSWIDGEEATSVATRKEGMRSEVSAETPLGDVLDFMKLLWGLDHNLQRVSKAMTGKLGVTGPQRLVLRIVALFPDIPAGGIASVLRLHPSSVTVLLNRLESEGFLARKQDPGDARRIKLRVTARGQRVASQTQGTVESVMKTVLSRFPPETVRAAGEVLAAIGAELAASVDKGASAAVPSKASALRKAAPRKAAKK